MSPTQTGTPATGTMTVPNITPVISPLTEPEVRKTLKEMKQRGKTKKADKKYSEAVSKGHYDLFQGGLSGKHDNIRTYWEDQIRGQKLRPHLQSMVDRKRRAGEKLRIVDLGAGTGEGLRLLTSTITKDADLSHDYVRVLPLDMVGLYLGSDLCEAMVEQGNVNYADHPNVIFKQGDFSGGFPHKRQKPFDLYFCSYGSYSHINDEALERLFTDVVQHAGPRALFVGEWLGRHSIEWPCYWDRSENEMMDYSMSWLPTEAGSDPEHFPMRYRIGEEIEALVGEVSRKTKTKISILELYNCSVFTGRHTDTGEYNDWIRPIRSAVNHLHEENVRTDLDSLKVDFVPVPEHDRLNSHYATLGFCWNNLVEFCQRRLEKRRNLVRLKNWTSFPPALQMAVMTLDRVIDTVSWMQMGDPRANIIEPQLGYALRSLEMNLQGHPGCGHSMIGVFEIRKS